VPAAAVQLVDDPIAFLKQRDAGTGLDDFAGEFMAQHGRQLNKREPADTVDDVAVADGAGVYFEKDLPLARGGRCNFFVLQVFRTAGLFE
jgi:hypothetical protein